MSHHLISKKKKKLQQKTMERSLVLIKPDCTLLKSAVVEVVKRLEKIEGVKITLFKHVVVTKELAYKHYEEHIGKSFFPALVSFITNVTGVHLIVMEGEEATSKIRKTLGPTMVPKAVLVEGCVRGEFGLNGGINTCHASDGKESGEREVKLWTEYYKFTPNEEEAKKDIKAYAEKYEGKYPTDVKEIREAIKKFLPQGKELRDVFAKYTDATDVEITELIKDILFNSF